MTLFLNKENFEKNSKKALELANNQLESENTEYMFDEENQISDLEVLEDGTITGNLIIGKENRLADADFEFKLSSKDVIKIVEGYRNRLGRLKTVLEALKE